MKRIRIRTIAVFAVAGLAGALLLRTSQSVQIAEDQLLAMKTSIEQEKDSIRLLSAEWAYLNSPERLEKLNDEFLDLMPPQPVAIITDATFIPDKIEDLPAMLQPSLSPQPVSYQTPPRKPSAQNSSKQPSKTIKSKPSDKDFTTLLKDIRKGTPQ